MRCENCPLAFWEETDWETGESELVCAIDMSAKCEDDSCSRTDKWIKSQDIEKLKDRYWEADAKACEEYLRKLGQI